MKRKLTVEPNPARARGKISIQGKIGATVYITVHGQTELTTVTLDKDGRAQVEVPVGSGEEFSVSDANYPKPEEIVIRVVSSAERNG